MDLWQLNIFCKVIEHRSFSKAGKAILLTQPTISSHIKDLEEHIGCKLLDRLGKEVVPTKVGQLLYKYALKLLKLRDETETALSEFQGEIKGQLVTGGSTIPGGYILPRIIGEFIQKYPDVKISLRSGDTESIIKNIISGDFEFGIVGAQTNEKRIVQEKLVEDEMRLIVPFDHKWAKNKSVTLEELFKEPFISREHGSGTLKSIRLSLNKKDYDINHLNIIAVMGNTVSVCQTIKSNAGISIISPLAVSYELYTGQLIALKIENLDLSRNFYLTKHKYRSLSPLSIVFIDFLMNNLN